MHTIKRLCERGVCVIITDFYNGEPLDINDDIREFTLHILLGYVQCKRSFLFQRTRETKQYLKEAGLQAGTLPWGHKVIRERGRKHGGRLEWDMDFLANMADVSRPS